MNMRSINTENDKRSDPFPKILGRIDSYDVIVIGHLKWNPYFNESSDTPRVATRPPVPQP